MIRRLPGHVAFGVFCWAANVVLLPLTMWVKGV